MGGSIRIYFVMTTQRCTCCHICHTSLKTSKREFFPCSACPSIICRQCIELTDQDWNEIQALKDWTCPHCNGDCPCKRCKNKVNSVTNGKPTEKKTTTLGKRRRSFDSICEDNAYLLVKTPRTVHSSSPVKIADLPEKDDKQSRIEELFSKNKQCLDYISRTERLLALIKDEQGRIQSELSCIAITSEKRLLCAVDEEYFKNYHSEMDTSDSGDSTSDSDEYDDGDIDFSKNKDNTTFVLSNNRRATIMA